MPPRPPQPSAHPHGRGDRRPLPALALALALLAGGAATAGVPPAPLPVGAGRIGAGVAFARAQAESAAGDTTIPAPVGFVNDFARLIDESSRARLEAFLSQVKDKTGAEFAVLTVPTTAPADPAEYKVRVFERWKLGQRGKDNGVLLLVAVSEHRIWFETGYGLEGALPDGLQSRIIREEMTPRFRAGDWSGGITAAVLRAAAAIAKEQGVTLEWSGRELRYSEGPSRRGRRVPVAWIALLAFVLIAHALTRPSRRRFRRGGPWYGGWGGGFGGGYGGGWGGGFGGGGSSFGGFGGGSSGGGGGGGSW